MSNEFCLLVDDDVHCVLQPASCMPRPCDWPVEGVAGWATANQSLPKKVDALAGQRAS